MLKILLISNEAYGNKMSVTIQIIYACLVLFCDDAFYFAK